MKKSRMSLVIIALLAVMPFMNFSCDLVNDCDGMGTLSIENSSLLTVQKLMIDGVNHGSVDPNETKEVKLAPGTHVWQMEGISGGTGCSAASVIIVECKTSSFKCSGK